MSARGWTILASLGFWMAVLGVLIGDGLLATIGALAFGGGTAIVVRLERGE